MPNPILVPILVDTVTRRRYTRVLTGAQTTWSYEDLPGVRCRIEAKGGDAERRGYGQVPEAVFLVTLHPDADVRGPGETEDPATGELPPADDLIVTGGHYAGITIEVAFLHRHAVLAHRKAEGKLRPDGPLAGP